jgi:hypothetical protein
MTGMNIISIMVKYIVLMLTEAAKQEAEAAQKNEKIRAEKAGIAQADEKARAEKAHLLA